MDKGLFFGRISADNAVRKQCKLNEYKLKQNFLWEIGEVEEKDIMAKLYGAAKLSNNKELVRRLDKRRNLKSMIANTIYCDIAYLLAGNTDTFKIVHKFV